jgi:hypothetical protein
MARATDQRAALRLPAAASKTSLASTLVKGYTSGSSRAASMTVRRLDSTGGVVRTAST